MGFVFICLSVVLMICGQTSAANNITSFDNYKILQAISERLEVIEENLNILKRVFDCGKPLLSNGHFDGNSTFAHAVMLASCNKGYSLHGNDYIKCTADGLWTTLPECKPHCKSPPVLNSRHYNEDKVYPSGSSVSITCNPGYNPHRNSEMICEEGVWNHIVECNLVDCGLPPSISDGYLNKDYNTTYNSTLTITCDAYFELVGSKPYVCEADGMWYGQQQCLRRICVDIDVNSTECFYKLNDIVLSRGRHVDTINVRGDTNCIEKCLNEDSRVAYIVQWSTYSIYCACYRATRDEIVETRQGSNTLIRARNIEILERAYQELLYRKTYF